MSPVEPWKKDLGKWLRRLRAGAGLSQSEAGAALGGVEARSIRRWENSGDVPGGEMLLGLLSAYGVRIEPAPPESAPRALNAELAALHTTLTETLDSIRADIALLHEELIGQRAAAAETREAVRLLEIRLERRTGTRA